MHPFRKKSKEHANKFENRCFQEVRFHPFVKAQIDAVKEPQFTSSDIKIIKIHIVKPEALEQVILELNLLKNKN